MCDNGGWSVFSHRHPMNETHERAIGTDMLRNHVKPNERAQKERRYVFRRGTTAWDKNSEKIRSSIVEETVRHLDEDRMDTT